MDGSFLRRDIISPGPAQLRTRSPNPTRSRASERHIHQTMKRMDGQRALIKHKTGSVMNSGQSEGCISFACRVPRRVPHFQ